MKTIASDAVKTTPRVILTGLALSLGAFATIVGGCSSASGGSGELVSTFKLGSHRDSSPLFGKFAGRYLVAACDADMSADAIVTRDLGPIDPLQRDVLTIVTFPIMEPSTPYAQIGVSNSALGSPTSLAMSPDGAFAFVVESRGPAPEGARTLDDLPPGENLAIVDLREPLKPEVRQTIYVGTEPGSIAMNAAGSIVAIATASPGAQLVLCEIDNGSVMGMPLSWRLMGVADEEARIGSISWQPAVRAADSDPSRAGQILAVTIPEHNQVMFYVVDRNSQNELFIAPLGSPVNVGKYPYTGAFSPDGAYFICSCLGWGSDVEGFMVGAPPGEVNVIRLARNFQKSGQTVSLLESHEVVSTVRVGVSPEALAITSDGRYVVTANLQHSILPDSDPRVASGAAPRGGSLSLLAFDDQTGQLLNLSEHPVDAVPSGLAFDAQNELLAVTQFRSFEPGAVDGEVAFFSLISGKSPRLEPMDYYVGLGKGPHAVKIVR